MNDLDSELYHFFNALESDRRCLLIDTFTMICWIHLQGEKTAARKLMPDLFRTVGRELSDHRYDSLMRKVLKVIDGNEKYLIEAVPTRVEFKAMFDGRKPSR